MSTIDDPVNGHLGGTIGMGCQGGPSYSLTLQAASAHYAHSPLCFQSQMSLTVGKATAILPSRPSDAEKGDIQETAQEWSSVRHWRCLRLRA